MTVKDLMEILKGMPKNARICVWDKDRFPHEKENPFLMGKSKGAMDAYLDVIQIIKSLQDGN